MAPPLLPPRRPAAPGVLLPFLLLALLPDSLLAQAAPADPTLPPPENEEDAAPETSDPAAESLLAQALSAMGAQHLPRLQTLQISQTLQRGRGAIQQTLLFQAPNRFRLEESSGEGRQFQRTITATDGARVWTLQASNPKARPAPVGGAEARDFNLRARFPAPWFHAAALEWKLVLLGQTPVAGRPAHELKVYYPGGRIDFLYLDVQTSLVIAYSARENLGGTPVYVDTIFRGFKQVEGVVIPSKGEFAVKGTPLGSFTVHAFTANTPLDDALFAPPGASEREVWLRQDGSPQP